MISVFYCSLRKKNWFQEPLQLETGLLLVDKIFHGCYASCGLIAIMCKCALHSYKLGDLYINKYIYSMVRQLEDAFGTKYLSVYLCLILRAILVMDSPYFYHFLDNYEH